MDWWYGLIGPSVLWPVVFTLIATHFTFIGITVYLHRHSAHRALDMHPALQHVFRFWLWFTTGMGTKAWTAVHRKHHAKTETEDDPHSPVVQGLYNILFKGAEAYREAIVPETLERYGKGTPDDWIENNVYDKFDKIGVGSLMVLDVLLFGTVGIVVWGIQMIWIPFFAAGVINGIGHAWGYRNFECSDHAKNIVPWGIFICGEELHNNHHTYPNSPKLSVKPWEFDLGWVWIRIFEIFGLAKAKAVGPLVERCHEKRVIDLDTTWAVLNDRFRVMANFAEDVVAPLVRREHHRRLDSTQKRLLRRARKVICRDEKVLNDQDKALLEQVTRTFPQLERIYQYRVELTEVWKKRTGSREEMLEALRNWCANAESTGLDVMKKFVRELKSYSTPRLAGNLS